MTVFPAAATRGIFELLWAARIPGLVRRLSKAKGLIFSLHRVVPDDPADFAPNAVLQVRPEFLDYVIRRVRHLGIEIVDLGEGLRRVESDAPEKPFAVFTFDDAYRDNLRHALPILRRHQCPFTLYVATALADGVGEVWWQALEDIVAAQSALAVTIGGDTDYFPAATLGEKRTTYDQLFAKLGGMPEPDRVKLIRDLAGQYGYDLDAQCRALIMDWSELRTFARDQLCTIGAHTVHHYDLAKLSPEQALGEIEQSMRVIKAQFGKLPLHLSYPMTGPASAGPREYQMAKSLGLRSAVTSTPGGLYASNRSSLHALPRIPLNGLYQTHRYVDVLATPLLAAAMPRS